MPVKANRTAFFSTFGYGSGFCQLGMRAVETRHGFTEASEVLVIVDYYLKALVAEGQFLTGHVDLRVHGFWTVRALGRPLTGDITFLASVCVHPGEY